MPPHEQSRHARGHPKTCPVCGVEYMGRKNQIFCSYDCYKEHKRRYSNKKSRPYNSQKAAEQSVAFRDRVGKQAKIAVSALSPTERLELSYAFLSVYEGQKLYFCGAHSHSTAQPTNEATTSNASAQRAVMHLDPRQRMQLAAMLAEAG